MTTLFIMSIVGFVMFLLIAKAGKAGDARGKVLRNGIDARGIILSADRTSLSRTTLGGVRYETRQLLLDIEVPGRAPYELSIAPLIPRVCDALPGSTLDLRVDPANPNNVAILGPAGSLGWMGAMPLLFPRVGLGATSGCAKPILSLIFVPFILLFGVLSFVSGDESRSEEGGGGSHSSASKHETCEAAARCCNKIAAASGCKQFKTMSESACRTALEGERKAAAKLKKVCE